MKIDKYSAILGNTVGFHNMSTLTDHRPVASLPFGGKYRLIDFPLSSLANAGVRSVFGIFQQDNISSVFDHIRSGREWGLSTLLSHYYLGIYNTRVESSTVGKEYYQQLLTYLKRSGSNQTVALNCDVLINIDLNQVFHLHSTTKEPITVVYKKLAKKDISEVNAILDVDETDHVLSHKLFSLFSPNQKIYTKVKNEEPTYYANTSKVSTSQFASGSIIEGQVANSVLSRNIHVHKDSLVKDSLLFPRVVIGEGAQVEYAILDKGVEVEPGVVIRGTAEHPVVVKKGAKVTEDIHS